jgi:hypothetical protein
MLHFGSWSAEPLRLTVPYIKAGLEDNEFCMLITGGPVNENDAMRALEQVLPHAHEYLANKQLEFFSHSQWYLSSGIFDGQRVLGNWLAKFKHAQANGFAGIALPETLFGSDVNRTGSNSVHTNNL